MQYRLAAEDDSVTVYTMISILPTVDASSTYTTTPDKSQEIHPSQAINDMICDSAFRASIILQETEDGNCNEDISKTVSEQRLGTYTTARPRPVSSYSS